MRSDVPQLKWPSGQVFPPCKPQGRQASCSLVSTIIERSAKGPNPNLGTVAQKKAVVGVFIAEAMCIGPESLT